MTSPMLVHPDGVIGDNARRMRAPRRLSMHSLMTRRWSDVQPLACWERTPGCQPECRRAWCGVELPCRAVMVGCPATLKSHVAEERLRRARDVGRRLVDRCWPSYVRQTRAHGDADGAFSARTPAAAGRTAIRHWAEPMEKWRRWSRVPRENLTDGVHGNFLTTKRSTPALRAAARA